MNTETETETENSIVEILDSSEDEQESGYQSYQTENSIVEILDSSEDEQESGYQSYQTENSIVEILDSSEDEQESGYQSYQTENSIVEILDSSEDEQESGYQGVPEAVTIICPSSDSEPEEVHSDEANPTMPRRATRLSKDDLMLAESLLVGQDSEKMVEKFKLSIYRGDLRRLAPSCWLNDNIINFYLCLIVERSEALDHPSVYAMSTFFAEKLLDGGGHAAVRRWTRNVNIFAYDLILVPVNQHFHWTLAVIDMARQAITYYDSKAGENCKLLTALERYLCEEFEDKHGQPLDPSLWAKEHDAMTPQQSNNDDCGVYLCLLAKHLTAQPRRCIRNTNIAEYRIIMMLEIYEKCLRG
ncbi:sentrin-specific protease-like [Drosophila guanche]|uniref:sentrin-specific protease-like n=1 Tax=Drosophila guanche TaxID=7266 RepID=UPI001471A20B|nr:sentrin-specific protease-like [Drosophila guanche]